MKFRPTRYFTIFFRGIQRLQICKIPTEVIGTLNECSFDSKSGGRPVRRFRYIAGAIKTKINSKGYIKFVIVQHIDTSAS